MQVVVDDFSTGCSSFPDLKHSQGDGIMTDRTFVERLSGQAKDEELTRLMIAPGDKLNIPVVPEGIDTQTQTGALSRYDGNRTPGQLIAPALPAPQFAAYINRQSPYKETPMVLFRC